MSEAPLVSARDLRVDVDGAVVLDGVTFESAGDSLAVWGDTYALDGALAGRAKIRAGSLSLLGAALRSNAAFPGEAVGIALCDPPLPPRWSVREYLRAGARLAGASGRVAQTQAERALDELGLRALATHPVRELALPDRRAVVIAQATVTSPSLLIAVGPLAGLSGEPATYVAAVLAAACRGRKWIVTVRDLHPASAEHALAVSAADVVGFAGGKLVQHGTRLRDGASVIGYTLVVHGEVEALRTALASHDVRLTGGPLRYYIELTAAFGASEVLALAATVRAPIVELVPRVSLGAERRPEL